MTTTLTPDDIKVGRVFSAKRVQRIGLFPTLLNDRQVLYVNRDAGTVQYDSPTVSNGRHYPKTTIDAFLKWAKEDVTDQMPNKEDWRTA